ncbi:MAG: hypothetical protein ACUZ8E_17655 [Candidatus Anammoxibacter sp.]
MNETEKALEALESAVHGLNLCVEEENDDVATLGGTIETKHLETIRNLVQSQAQRVDVEVLIDETLEATIKLDQPYNDLLKIAAVNKTINYLAEQGRLHVKETQEGTPKEEWFYRWIARAKGGHSTNQQAINAIWYCPGNPYFDSNPWQTTPTKGQDDE